MVQNYCKTNDNRIFRIVFRAFFSFIMLTNIFGTEASNAVLAAETENGSESTAILSETAEELLTDLWYDSTEESVARTLANEKEEEYRIANKSYADYDEMVGRGSSTPSDVMSYLGQLKLDAEIKGFYTKYGDEIYNDARNRFAYDTLLKMLDYDLKRFEIEYIHAALLEAEMTERCTMIKAEHGAASSDSLQEIKTVVSDCKKQKDKLEKDIGSFIELFSAKYPNVEFPEEDFGNADFFTEVNTSDPFIAFSADSVTERFLQLDMTYVQMKYTLETYKSHMDKYGKYMRQNRDYKREAEREEADILHRRYSLEARKEMIEAYVKSLLAEYEALEKEIDHAEERLALARKNLETEQRKYSIGFSTKLILLKRETELRKTEYTLENLKIQKIKMEFMIENGILP